MHGRLVYRRVQGRGRSESHLLPQTSSPLLRLNTVCPYYTMFPLDFPLWWLAKARKDDWVLDPFCGRGTTVFASRLLGLGCVGIDSNPIAAAIAAAKLVDTTADAVVDLARRLLEESDVPAEIPKGEFWDLCFHPSTLRDICVVRECLLRACSSAEEVVLRALILGILHGPRQKGVPTYLSNQMPRTYATKPAAAVRFWKRKRLTSPPAVDVLGAITRRAQYTLSASPPPVMGAVYFGDARRADVMLQRSRRFAWVVTSPPYFGMRTYRPDQWLRNWFLGADTRIDYSQDGQLVHHADRFSDELATVWRAVGRRCLPGARLIVRFGCLPSIPADVRDVLRASFKRANIGWRIQRWADAGSSSNGRRQSDQFGRCRAMAACEIDAYVRLEA